MFLFRFVICCSFLVATGCGRKIESKTASVTDLGSPDAVRVTLNRKEGVREVYSSEKPKYNGPIIEIERDLVIGVEEHGPDWQLFAGYPWLLVAPDGGMIIGDSRMNELFLVDRNGNLIKRFGGAGGGPGEFGGIRDMFWLYRGREFWINDGGLWRISRYNSACDLLGTINTSELGFQWMDFTSARNGCLIALGMQEPQLNHRRGRRFAVLDTSFQMTLDFGFLPGHLSLWVDGVYKGGMPYGYGSDLKAFPDGRLLLTFPEEGTIVILSPTGDVLTRIHGVGERRQFSEDEKRWFRRTRASSPYAVKNADRYLPKYLPAFGTVIPDDRDRIWVTRIRTNREILDSLLKPTIDLYTADGTWIGSQELDVSFRQIWGDFGYRCMGLRDEIPGVERWRIIPLVPEAAGTTSR